MAWGRLSDRIGRKVSPIFRICLEPFSDAKSYILPDTQPVVLMGLVGVSLSMLAFGISKHLYSLVISRCMAGFLSGNVAITKASVAEVRAPTPKSDQLKSKIHV